MKEMNEYILPDQKEESRRSREMPDTEYDLFSLNDEAMHLGDGKTYYIRTFGCQANVRDGETISGILEMMGYTAAENPQDADIAVFNTCAVRQLAEEKAFGEIGMMKKAKMEHPEKIIAVCGCMAQESETVKRIMDHYSWIDLVFGTHNLYRLPALLLKYYKEGQKQIEVFSEEGKVIENLPVHRMDSCRGFVNIMYGCDKFCTYCIVPYTRGRQRSRRIEDIIEEVNNLKASGRREVTLLGQNVNAYGRDLNMEDGFSKLLEAVSDTGIERIRFYTSNPRDYTSASIDVMAERKNIMNAVHLPVQSGSNEILRRMARGYTVEHYNELVEEMRSKIPDIALSTDLIVGFPGETDSQFEETLDLVRRCRFDLAYAFVYSPRQGTPAARMKDDIPPRIKKERLMRLNEVLADYARQSSEKFVGKTVKVLCDGEDKKKSGRYSGYTEENKLVNFDSEEDVRGQIVDVKITKANSYTLQGRVLAKKDS